MENNTGGASNTAPEKSSGSATIQKTTGSGPASHQEAKEALSHQVKEAATRSLPSPRTSRMAFYPSRTKLMSKPFYPNSISISRETSRPGTETTKTVKVHPQVHKLYPYNFQAYQLSYHSSSRTSRTPHMAS